MSDAAAGATEESSPSKLDPEKLSLRAQPAPAVRFKRGMVIGLAAIASIGVFGVAWMALQPGTSQIVGRADADAAVLSKAHAAARADRQSVVSGKSGSRRAELGGRRLTK